MFEGLLLFCERCLFIVFADFHIAVLQLAYVNHSPVVIVYDMHYTSSKTKIHHVGLLISNETKMEAATGCTPTVSGTLLSTLEGMYPT